MLHGPEVTRPAFAGSDSFALATSITTPQYSGIVATADTTGATTEAGEPTLFGAIAACNSVAIPTFGATAWYTWTAPGLNGTAVFDTYGSSFDTTLAIYTGGAVNALTVVKCNRDFPFAGDASAVALSYTAGTTYRIQVGGVASATGSLVLSMSTGAEIFLNSNQDNITSDIGLTLREGILLARGGTTAAGLNRALSAQEAALVLNAAAFGASNSDVVRFSAGAGFVAGGPFSTITMSTVLPDLSSNGDTISGIGAGVLINGNGLLCVAMSGNLNRIEGLDVRNCSGTGAAGVYITGNNNTVGGETVPAQGMEISVSDYGILVDGSGDGSALGNRIVGNFLGTSRDGSPRTGNRTGISLNAGADFTFIGGPTAAERNIISNSTANGIEIVSSHDATIKGNYIGTNVAGTAALPNFVGIKMASAVQHIIGGSAAGSGNLISGNQSIGIWAIPGSALPSNIGIFGNLIGTDATGTAAIPNGTGVIIQNGTHIAIGGQSAGEGNLISGNQFSGITVAGAGTLDTRVWGNKIGTNLTGTVGIPNSRGIQIDDASGVSIGGAGPEFSNLISGNSFGVRIVDTGNPGEPALNTIAGNLIGTNAAGTGAVPNTIGVDIAGGINNTVGGNSAGARNVISGNSSDGVLVRSSNSRGNKIVGNYIGLSSAGTNLGNGGDGVEIAGVPSNTVGGETAAERNIVSGNGEAGINISGTPRIVRTFSGIAPISDLSTITLDVPVGFSNPIVDVDVEVDLSHTWDSDLDIFLIPPAGPTIELTTDNGGAGDDYRVTVFDDEASTAITTGQAPFNGRFRPEAPLSVLDGLSPLGTWNLQITDDEAGDIGTLNSWSLKFTASGGNRVLGNYIGTNPAGTAEVPNRWGVLSSGELTTIGGLSSGARNVISGNVQGGVIVYGSGTMDNVVQGNFIGTNAAGTAALASGGHGVELQTGRNKIGGRVPGARNVISGNQGTGVYISGSETENVVEGNFVGVGADGSTAIGNNGSGLEIIGAGGHTIGGALAGAGNVIAHNGFGMIINSPNNGIFGNTVRNNSADGIATQGTNNEIGETSPGGRNVITANGGDGVNVFGGTGNLIATNSISGNGGLGIDLAGDGVTLNDAGDGDPGPNYLQNYPVLTAVSVNTGFGETSISGSFDSIANEGFTVSFFHNNTCDAAAHGEGEVFIGSALIGGSSIFGVTFQVEVPLGRFVTATATRMSTLDTSEFSKCVPSADDADDDNDGFTDVAEASIGTSALDPCGNNGWPADLQADNRLNIGDLNSFLFPLGTNDGHGVFNYFGHPVPDPGRANEERWNLLVDGMINIGDLNALNPAVDAPTSRPPMFGGQPAFFTNGGLCPFPP